MDPKETPNRQNIHRWGNWLDFTLGYIGATFACADAYLSYKSDTREIPLVWYRVAFIPAFWNFKHAIELGIKLLFPSLSDKPWGHNLIENLEKYKSARNLSDEECKELKVICEKYANLEPLKKLKDARGNDFVSPMDFKNQFFHYPDGDESHSRIYNVNNNFVYYSLGTHQPDNNEEVMRELMEELKQDALFFAKILSKYEN